MSRSRRAAVYAAAAAITIYGALLRLDAYVGKYGPLNRPAWARVMTHGVATFASGIRPARVQWTPERRPYVGGDPIGYLNFARQMTSFYQPHFREPVFLTATRAALWMLNGQDAAVSLASAAGSVLTIVAAFLLVGEVVGPIAGLGAALILAVEYDLIAWSVDGWRDDLFSAFVLLSAWALVRLQARPAFERAVTAGLICGLTCLTRITALSFIVPALAWIAIAGGRDAWRRRLESTAVAAVLTLAVVGPFLLSCAIAFGDPLLAIDQHTIYYRAAEGQSLNAPVGAGSYVLQKFRSHPIATTDTAVNGEFVRPFALKWNGFGVWSPSIGSVLEVLSLIGLSVFLFVPAGRLLLLVTAASLVPYAFTWNVGAGGEWRFTMHVYGLYVAAALFAAAMAPRLLDRRALPLIARRSAAILALAVAATVVYLALPWFVIREALVLKESVSVEAGDRDRVFFRSGWTPPRAEGTVTTRRSEDPRATIHFPLPASGDYDVVLRVDPISPAAVSSAMVLFNGQIAGGFGFIMSPQRIGSYRVTLPRVWQKTGDNEVTIAATGATGVRLWLLRIIPMSK